MDALSKILAFLFSLITALGVIPKGIPTAVTLPKIGSKDVIVSTDCYDFSYDSGKFSLSYNGNTMFSDAVSEVKLSGKTVSSAQYDNVTLETQAVSDTRGSGTAITATLTSAELPTMKQHFTFYKNTRHFLMSTELVAGEGEVASNYIAPIVIRHGNIQNANPRFTNFLKVPFDNDAWAEFEVVSVMESALSRGRCILHSRQ